MVLSEHTKDMLPDVIDKLVGEVNGMTKREIKKFQDSLEPDMMGFCDKEGVDDGFEDK